MESKNLSNVKRLKIINKAHFIFALIIFLFWAAVFLFAMIFEGGDMGMGVLVFIPFFYANIFALIISAVITVVILIKDKNKKEKIRSIVSTILISAILWIFPILIISAEYFNKNIYIKYLRPVSWCGSSYTCYLKMAYARNDLSICEKIKEVSYKDYCYINIAQLRNDLSICEKIKNAYIKEKCRKGKE